MENQTRISILVVLLSVTAWYPRGMGQEPIQQPSQVLEPNELIRLQRFDEAIEVLTRRLASNPNEEVSRYKLILVYLKVHRPVEAAAEFEAWKQSSPGPNALRDPITTLIPTLELDPKRELQLRDQLRHSLEQKHVKEAGALIDQMAISKTSRQILKSQVDLYGGNFIEALSRTSTIANSAGVNNRYVAAQLVAQITKSFHEYTRINEDLSRFLESQLSVSSCSPVVARKAVGSQQFSLQDYIRLVINANREYPLNPHFLDLEFHAALVASIPYKDLEALGDRILNAKGTLRIPFYSRDKLFDVVISRDQQKIYTEPSPKFYSNVYGSSDLKAFVPFDVAFNEVREIHQKIQIDRALLGIASSSSVLMIQPGAGDAPCYTFMHLLQCLYGDEAQRNASRNLGTYIAHAINNPKMKIGLVSSNGGSDWIISSSKLVATVGVSAAVAAGFAPPMTNGNQSQGLGGTTSSQSPVNQQKMMADSLSLLEVTANELVRQSEIAGGTSDREKLLMLLKTKAFPLIDPTLPHDQGQRLDRLLESLPINDRPY